MTTKGRVLKYVFYIEGVEVPVQTIQINNTSGQGCNLTANILPSPLCYKLHRGMKVTLYKRVNNNTGVLRFSGILMNKVYGKSGASRELRIECASPDIRLQVMRMSEVNQSGLSAAPITALTNMYNILSSEKVLDWYGDITEFAKSSNFAIALQYKSTGASTGANILSNTLAKAQSMYAEKGSYTKEDLDMGVAIEEKLNSEHSDSLITSMYNYIDLKDSTKLSSEDKETRKKEIRDRFNEVKKDAESKDSQLYAFLDKIDITKDDDLEKLFVSSAIGRGYASLKKMTDEGKVAPANAAKSIVQTMQGKSIIPLNTLALTEVSVPTTTYGEVVFSKAPTSGAPAETSVDSAASDLASNTSTSQLNENSAKEQLSLSIASRFSQRIVESKNDMLAAIINFIMKDVYGPILAGENDEDLNQITDPFTRTEFISFRLDEAYCKLNIISGEDFVNVSSGSTAKNDYSRPLLSKIRDQLSTIVKSNNAGVPVLGVVLQMLSTIFCKYSIYPNRLYKNIIFHPNMSNYFPPLQNVVFPNRISSIQYNTNDWLSPTRTYMIFKPYLMPHTTTTIFGEDQSVGATVAVAPKEDMKLVNMNSRVGQQMIEALKNDASVRDTATKIRENSSEVTSEDTDALSKYSKKNQKIMLEAYKLTKKTITDEEIEQGKFINIKEYGLGNELMTSGENQEKMADMFHGFAKYGVRTCSFTGGDELDTLIVGMPILIVDGVYSIYGVVESMMTTILGEGQITVSVTVSMPRMPLMNKYDVINSSGLWLETANSSPDVIGTKYEELFGKGQSLVAKCKELQNMSDKIPDLSELISERKTNKAADTNILRVCIAILHNAYLDAKNRDEFVEKLVKPSENLESEPLERNQRMYEAVQQYLTSLRVIYGNNNTRGVIPQDCFRAKVLETQDNKLRVNIVDSEDKIYEILGTTPEEEKKSQKQEYTEEAIKLAEKIKGFKDDLNVAKNKLSDLRDELGSVDERAKSSVVIDSDKFKKEQKADILKKIEAQEQNIKYIEEGIKMHEEQLKWPMEDVLKSKLAEARSIDRYLKKDVKV